MFQSHLKCAFDYRAETYWLFTSRTEERRRVTVPGYRRSEDEGRKNKAESPALRDVGAEKEVQSNLP